MTTDTGSTVTWAITFGLGTEHKGTYTEIVMPAAWSIEYQAHAAYVAACERYGRDWAFAYPPEKIAESVHAYGITTVRDMITIDVVKGSVDR
jgi:hypothetical protein